MLTLLRALILAASISSRAMAIPAITAQHAIPAITAQQTAKPTKGSLRPGNIKGIVPTSSGQIGVNPVNSDLGDASSYSGYIIGGDSSFISEGFTTDPSQTSSIVSSTKASVSHPSFTQITYNVYSGLDRIRNICYQTQLLQFLQHQLMEKVFQRGTSLLSSLKVLLWRFTHPPAAQ